MNDQQLLKQSGVTLIELLLAMSLGLFLTGGVLKVFAGSKQSYHVLENSSRMQENGRFAMGFISRDLRRVGHRAFITGESVCVNDKTSTALRGTSNLGINGSDTMVLLLPSKSKCPIKMKQVTYAIREGASGRPAFFRGRSELVEDIDMMSILYGEDTNNDSSPNHYVEADFEGLNMAHVVSIRVTLVAKSARNNLSRVGDGRLTRTLTSTIALRNRLP